MIIGKFGPLVIETVSENAKYDMDYYREYGLVRLV
jgi:hypothetical protein